ncbi:MAG: transposase [Myxococcaceae bacterium]|nr:transposase [Myxococcaceae bacterium]
MFARPSGVADLFYLDQDYYSYLDTLEELARSRAVEVLAYCLHPTQIRLLMIPGQLSLSRAIQRLHTRHALRMNQHQKRFGPLFQNRFESRLLHSSSVLEAVRNTHLWPVRQGFVRRAENYAWSSHSAYLNPREANMSFLSTQPILSLFAGSETSSRRAFDRYVESASLEADDVLSIPSQLNPTAQPIKHPKKANLKFLDQRVALFLGIETKLIHTSSRRQDRVLARRLFATVASLKFAHPIREIAAYLKRDKAQISRLVSQGMDLIDQEGPFKIFFDSV